MRVLMFSWEYPPHVVGGLGKHVAEILPPLGNLENLEVHLVTPRWGGGAARETVGAATVHRIDPPITEGDFYTGAWQTSDQARAIHHVEWWLTYESWRVIACS